jgi:PTH1 family peptidyl-tRNA hydrolase
VTLLEPLTYMNVSGEAVRAWRERSGAEHPDGMLVIADDVYLPVGVLRLRPAGASGGHRGLESIEQELGTREYARLRIGVGAADGLKLRDHVLAEPEGDERRSLEAAAEQAADAVECWIAQGIHTAMNRFNRKATKEVSES